MWGREEMVTKSDELPNTSKHKHHSNSSNTPFTCNILELLQNRVSCWSAFSVRIWTAHTVCRINETGPDLTKSLTKCAADALDWWASLDEGNSILDSLLYHDRGMMKTWRQKSESEQTREPSVFATNTHAHRELISKLRRILTILSRLSLARKSIRLIGRLFRFKFGWVSSTQVGQVECGENVRHSAIG